MLDDLSRSDTYPYIDIQEDDTTMTHEATVGKVSADQVFYLMSRGLTENEATEPHRPGLPRGLHQGTADGVRHRVQPPREARDGGVARMTESPTASPRPRPARLAGRSTDLTLPRSTTDLVERARAAGEPAWLRADRRAALRARSRRCRSSRTALHDLPRPAAADLDDVAPYDRRRGADRSPRRRCPSGADGARSSSARTASRPSRSTEAAAPPASRSRRSADARSRDPDARRRAARRRRVAARPTTASPS